MPANYDYKRLIGWIKRSGGAIVTFDTYETEGGGIELKWKAPTQDVNLANTLTTTRRTDALKVPLNFSTTAHVRVELYDNTAQFSANIGCPDETDAAAGANVRNVFQAGASPGAGTGIRDLHVRTSSTGTIFARADLATVDQYSVITIGFKWARRN